MRVCEHRNERATKLQNERRRVYTQLTSKYDTHLLGEINFMSTKKATSLKTLESSMSELQLIIEKMSQKNLSLEESMELFEKGVKLTNDCQIILNKAEQQVEILLSQNHNSDQQEVN